MDLLCKEVLRIVTAPYATSLKGLSEILSSCTSESLLEWADTYPCQISPLATAVLNALNICPETLVVIRHLGAIREVRDALLCQNPNLLDGLLRNALSNDKHFEKYAPACVSLLSTPLSNHISTPLLIAPFFLKCVDDVADSSSATEDALRRVYALVANGYAYLVSSLTANQTVHLHECLGNLLQNSEQSMVMLSLACLACLVSPDSQLESSSGLVSGQSTPDPSAPRQQTRQNPGRQSFFNGNKSVKLLRLVCDNVISSVTKSSSYFDMRTLEVLRLSAVVVEAVSDEKRFEYINSSVGRSTVKSIITKLNKVGCPMSVQGHAVDYLNCLAPPNMKVPGLQELSEKVMKGSRSENAPFGTYALPKSFNKLRATSDSNQFTEALRQSFILASSATNFSQSNVRNCMEYLQEIVGKVPSSLLIRQNVLAAFVTNEFTEPIKRFLSTSSNLFSTVSHDASQPCSAHQANLKKQLRKVLCAIPLQVSFFSNPDEGPKIDPSLLTRFHEKSLEYSSLHYQCLCSYPKQSVNGPGISIVEENSTPSNTIDSRDWRRHLASELAMNATRQQEILLHSVGEICRDLEARCEDIEEPLRKEQNRAAELVKEIDLWKSKAEKAENATHSMSVTLKQECEEKDNEIKRLSEDLDRLEGHVDQAVAKISECQITIKEYEAELSSAQEELVQVKHAHQEDMDELIGNQMAEMNERQECIDEFRRLSNRRGEENKELQGAIKNFEDERRDLHEQIDGLDKELAETGLELECAKTEVIRKQNSIDGLETELSEGKEEIKRQDENLEELNNHIITLTNNVSLHESNRRNNEMKKEREKPHTNIYAQNGNLNEAKNLLSAKLEALENEVSDIYFRHQNELESQRNEGNAKVSKLQSEYDEDVEDLRSQIAEMEQKSAAEREQLLKDNKSLKTKVTKLSTVREQQEKRIADAQELHHRFMAVMGGNVAPPSLPMSTLARDHQHELAMGTTEENTEADTDVDSPPEMPLKESKQLQNSRRQTIAAISNADEKRGDRRRKEVRIVSQTPIQPKSRAADLSFSSNDSPTPKRPKNKTTTARSISTSSVHKQPSKLTFKATKPKPLPSLPDDEHMSDNKENHHPTPDKKKLLSRASSVGVMTRQGLGLGMDIDFTQQVSSTSMTESSGNRQVVPASNGMSNNMLEGLGSMDFNDTTLEEF